MGEPQVFCTSCGTALRGGRFCPHCGAATEPAETGGPSGAAPDGSERLPATKTMRSYPTPPAAMGSPPSMGQSPSPAADHRYWIIAGAAALAAAIAVVLVLVLSSGGSSYVQRSQTVLVPLLQANQQLTGALGSLRSGGGSAGAKSAVKTTLGAAQTAQQTLVVLSPGSGDGQYANNLQAALTSEIAFLNAASSALSRPSGGAASRLQTLGDETKSKFLLITTQVPAAGSSFSGGEAISAYVARASGAASTRSALKRFSDQIGSLLSQSASSFHEINEVFGQMESVANGNGASYTLAQAEGAITSVISNRTALAASARALDAQTPLAGAVRDALAGAFDASLKNDRDIENCLNQANTGSVAFIFQGCLSSTAADSDSATSAKQHFFTLYNEMRHNVGQSSASQQF